MWRWTTIVFFGTCLTLSLEQNNDDQLIESVFGPNSGGGGFNTSIPEIPPQVDSNTGESKNCECVPYYLCNDDEIITDGMGLIDIRNKDCDSYLDFCCSPPKIIDKGQFTTHAPPVTPDDTSDTPIIPIKGCGRRNPDGVGFRIKGDEDNESQFGEFPWMVAILTEEQIEGSDKVLSVYHCGGTLIHPKAVITAAHCVTNGKKRYVVRAGEWDTQTKKELYPDQDRVVESVTIHPQYYAGALFNDIAFLLLAEPMKIEPNVDVACLPPQGFKLEHTRCFATGWGRDSFGKEGKYQVILKKIDLPIVDRHTCQEQLRKTRLGRFFELHKSFICAGGEPGKDTCKGDGGSPLVCPIPGEVERYQHSGIVAWGIGCGENNVPGVYANVALFRHWIDDQMALHNLETSYYEY